MKKHKIVLALLLALVLILTVSLAVACDPDNTPDNSTGDSTGGNTGNNSGDNTGGNTGNNNPPPVEGTWELQNITLEGTYKKEYQLNDTFTSEGIKVSALMKNTETKATRTDDVTAQAVIDSSRFNSAMVGSYVITVSYTSTKVTRYASYTVTVAPYEPAINGIAMSKTKVDYDVPNDQSTVAINLDDITVNAVDENGEVATTPLAADAYTLTFYKDGELVDSLAAASKGAYTIQAERKSDHQKAFVVVYVLDPAVSIAFKTGTVTQGQDLTDKMTPDWTFTVTNRSGTTRDVTVGDVELSSINSLVPGSYTASVSYNEYDAHGNLAAPDGIKTAVNYSVTKVDGMVNQSYAVNISAVGNKTVTSANEATDGILSQAGGISLVTGTRTITIEANGAKCGTKVFTSRLKFGGKSENNGRQIKVELKGASLITVYAKSGSSSSARGIGLYSDATVNADKRLDNTEQMLGTVVALTYLVNEAGAYYLAAPDGDVNIYYIQVDTVLVGDAAEGQQSVSLPTATEVSGITINTDNVKKDFVKGDTFTYEGLTVSKNIYNPVTAEQTTEAVTDGYTVAITAGSMTEQCEATVTVTLNGKTATYKINVNSLVDGVNGIKVTLPNNTIELDKAGEEVTLKEEDVTIKTDAGEAITPVEGSTVAGQCKNLVIELYSVAEDGTETLLDNLTIGAGTYKVKVTATYNNSHSAGTTDFTDEVTLTVKVKAAAGDTTTESFRLADLTTIDGYAETGYTVNGNINDNSLFTLIAKVAMKTSFGAAVKAGNTGICSMQEVTSSSSNAISYIAMDGTTISPTQGIRLSKELGIDGSETATVSSAMTVTAKSKITLKLYVAFANNSFNSDRKGTIFYSVDGGTATEQQITKRKNVLTIEVTLEEGQVLTLGATNGHTSTANLWLFGAEATSIGGGTTTQPHSHLIKSDTFDATTAITLTERTEWFKDDDGDSVYITAASGATVTIETGGKTAADQTAFANRIKLGGTGTKAQRSVEITVTERATITVYAISSSSSAARKVQFIDSNGTAIDLVVAGATLDGTAFTADTTVGGDKIYMITVTVEAGTYYFGSAASGLNVYGVNLEIGAANA